jgi:molybdopterin synthase catalytic subunit
MLIKVRLFAMLRQQAGWRERELDLPDGATIGDAWQLLANETPALAPQRDHVRFALNREYAAADQPLADGDELAFIPPVAGGSDAYVRLEIREEPFDDELFAQLRRAV